MNKQDYLQSANDECVYNNYQDVVEHMQSFMDTQTVKLAIVHFEDYYDTVWYASIGCKLVMFPAFKETDIYSYYTAEIEFYIEDILPNQYFFRHGELYYLDNKMNICKIAICYKEEQACMYAQKFNVEVSNCSLVKLYTIGQTRKFVTTVWLVDADEVNTRIIVPVFTEDRALFDNFGLYDFDLEKATSGTFFIKNNRIWRIEQDENNMLYVEKTTFHIIPGQKN